MKNKNNYQSEYVLPKDTVACIKTSRARDNNYLSFYRFVFKEERGKKSKIKPFKVPDSSLYREVYPFLKSRQKKLANLYSEQKFEFKFELTDKLLIGGPTPFSDEFTTMLHTLYGVPYIPATALKGVVRHCWVHEMFDGKEREAEEDELFVRCLGKGTGSDEGKKGNLIFFDAFPIGSYKIEKDVLTPHYQGYYSRKGSQEPTDDRHPIPIGMKAVKDTTFMVTIGVEKDGLLSEGNFNVVYEIIKAAFMEYGIGAKTALGYGLGDVIPVKQD